MHFRANFLVGYEMCQ